MSVPQTETYYVITGINAKNKRFWIRKSGRDGRGVWQKISFRILEIKTVNTFKKVWPLAPLEALAQAAE